MLAVAALILLVSYLVSSVDGKSFSFFHSCCVLEFISESFFLYYYYISKKKCERERRLVCCSKKGIEKYFFFLHWGKSDRGAPACSSPQGDGSITLDGLALAPEPFSFLFIPKVSRYMSKYSANFFVLAFYLSLLLESEVI